MKYFKPLVAVVATFLFFVAAAPYSFAAQSSTISSTSHTNSHPQKTVSKHKVIIGTVTAISDTSITVIPRNTHLVAVHIHKGGKNHSSVPRAPQSVTIPITAETNNGISNVTVSTLTVGTTVLINQTTAANGARYAKDIHVLSSPSK